MNIIISFILFFKVPDVWSGGPSGPIPNVGPGRQARPPALPGRSRRRAPNQPTPLPPVSSFCDCPPGHPARNRYGRARRVPAPWLAPNRTGSSPISWSLPVSAPVGSTGKSPRNTEGLLPGKYKGVDRYDRHERDKVRRVREGYGRLRGGQTHVLPLQETQGTPRPPPGVRRRGGSLRLSRENHEQLHGL